MRHFPNYIIVYGYIILKIVCRRLIKSKILLPGTNTLFAPYYTQLYTRTLETFLEKENGETLGIHTIPDEHIHAYV